MNMSDDEYNEDSLELLDALEIGIDVSEVRPLMDDTDDTAGSCYSQTT